MRIYEFAFDLYLKFDLFGLLSHQAVCFPISSSNLKKFGSIGPCMHSPDAFTHTRMAKISLKDRVKIGMKRYDIFRFHFYKTELPR